MLNDIKEVIKAVVYTTLLYIAGSLVVGVGAYVFYVMILGVSMN